MAFTLPREPSTTESLQCLACAGYQVIGSTFGDDDLIKLMKGNHSKQNVVKDLTGIDWNTMSSRFDAWVTEPSDPKLLGIWIKSSVSIAKSLEGSQYLQGNYKFYRQDQFPTEGSIKSFKDVFDLLKKKIKTSISKDPKFGKGVAGKVLGGLTLNSDKWNPADIIAVKLGSESKWNNEINGFNGGGSKRKSTLRNDLASYLEGKGKNEKKLDIVPAMQDLYEYNKLINQGIDSKEFVPISLKQSTVDDPHVSVVQVKEPRDLEKYFTMTVKITDVEYKANTQKALLKFEVDGLPGKEGKWSFDIRGFETTRQLGDIQLGLLKKGSATYHGKITLPVSTMITKLSGGRTALSKMNAMKRKLFAKSDPRVKRNLVSGRHGFVNAAIFADYYAKSAANIIEDAKLWGTYVAFLSKGKTSMDEFGMEATGDRHYTPAAKEYELKKSFTRAKYMKNKVQSYEQAYVLDGSSLGQDIKDNILKSMWMYAASEGFTIFNKQMNTTFLLSGSYVKCAA